MARARKKAESGQKRSRAKKGAGGATVRLSLAAYARHRGCSKTAVQKAIREGRLKESFTRTPAGHYRFDPEAADREWGGSTDYLRHPRLLALGSKRVDDALAALGNPDLNKVRILKEAALAEEARLRVEEREGKLIPLEEVERLWFSLGRAIRDGMLALPARLSSEAAASTDKKAIEIKTEAEINLVLEELSSEPVTTYRDDQASG